MNLNEKKYWHRFVWIFFCCLSLAFFAAYLVPESFAKMAINFVKSVLNQSYVDNYLSRFAAYTSPANGVLGMGVSWACAPALIYAGSIFMTGIVRKNANLEQKSKSTLLFRGLTALILFSIFVFTTVALAGVAPMYCRTCQGEPMPFMLTISTAGFCLSGAMLGAGISDIAALFRSKPN